MNKLKRFYWNIKHLEWLIRHMIVWFIMMRFEDSSEAWLFIKWHFQYSAQPMINKNED